MVLCEECDKEMSDDTTESCTLETIIIDGNEYPRDTEYYDVGVRCHDCNIVNKKGNYHHLGCDMERCPKCGGQLISCGCWGD